MGADTNIDGRGFVLTKRGLTRPAAQDRLGLPPHAAPAVRRADSRFPTSVAHRVSVMKALGGRRRRCRRHRARRARAEAAEAIVLRLFRAKSGAVAAGGGTSCHDLTGRQQRVNKGPLLVARARPPSSRPVSTMAIAWAESCL